MAKVTRLTLDSSGGLERRRLHLHEIAETDAPLDTVGQDLRNARQRKGEDLAQVSAALKIRKEHLDALEESEMELLPGRAYAIGFVRTYAAYLGLDPAEYVERLKAEIAGRGDSKEGNVPLNPPRERKLPQGGLIFAAVLLIALAYGSYYVVANRTATQTPTTPVPDRLAAQADLKVGSDTAQPAAAPAESVAPAAVVAPTPSVSAPAAAPGVSAAAETLPEGQKYGTQNANSHVTLRAHREARFDVTGPNNRTFLGRILKPGDTYQVPNFPGITLTTPDAGAVEVILDGSSVGFAGENGVAASGLSLNPRDIADRRGNAG
jgi:cytoskeleton protein RodZ